MKAKDLMIGDWVNYQPGDTPQYMKVGMVSGYDIQLDLYREGGIEVAAQVWFDEEAYIRPIPLTPEILEKNGFRKGCYVGGYYSPDCPFRVFTKKEGKCGFTTLFDDEIHFSCIFVHQLQHALRLCGIEKEIEL